MRAALCAIAAFVLGGCATAGTVEADPLTLTAEPIPASVLRLPSDDVVFLGGWVLEAPDEPAFGGLSGLLVAGTEAIAITDRGAFVTMSLERDGRGVITALGDAEIDLQIGLDGRPLRAYSADAEALARDAVSGVIWIAYERRHRIVGHRRLSDAPLATIDQLPTDVLSRNGGVEALAVAPDRAVIALIEDEGDDADAILGYRLALGAAEPFRIDRSGGFAPTGLDIAPDGSLYLLERRAGFLTGVSMRIRRFSAEAVRSLGEGADLGAGEIVVVVSGLSVVDNMEGLAVETSGEGGHVLTVVSDDNFSAIQRTILLQFHHRP